MQLRAHLNFGGNCELAFRFYEQHLGGHITTMITHGEHPVLKDAPAGWDKAALHARMTLGDSELLGNDVPPEHFLPMRSAYLSLAGDSTAEAERIYAMLVEEGQVFMPMEETFFAHRFAMLRDRFGTSWMLMHSK